ncbi:2-dehydropantoate 2-reductase [Apiospora saccharicola]|uniref:2-dehydropantoate 2-reductase n=1 Tax=Apiospora saccharicola TaxID=335842 RepID=A0ABR1TIY4_9PEZI
MSSADPVKPVHIVFVGAGAVGCFYASRLHHPSHNIYASLTARSNYDTIVSSGVTMQTHSFGDYVFKPYSVFPSVDAAVPGAHNPSGAAVPEDGWDYVVVTTKALPDRTDDAALIAPCAVTVISAEQIKQGTIRQNRWTRISIGPFGKGLIGSSSTGEGDVQDVVKRGEDCMSDLAGWWQVHGKIPDVKSHTELELQTIRWHKLYAELREHIMGVMREIWDAAPKVLGQSLPDDLGTPERIIKSTERNAGAKPSMLLDWEAGRPMELEVILGNPIRIAKEAGIDMPRLQSIYALLRSMQNQRDAASSVTKL